MVHRSGPDLAGRDAGWFMLANEAERKTWPIFQEKYREYCARIMAGEQLDIPAPEALPPSSGEISSKEDALAEIARIRESLKD